MEERTYTPKTYLSIFYFLHAEAQDRKLHECDQGWTHNNHVSPVNNSCALSVHGSWLSHDHYDLTHATVRVKRSLNVVAIKGVTASVLSERRSCALRLSSVITHPHYCTRLVNVSFLHSITQDRPCFCRCEKIFIGFLPHRGSGKHRNNDAWQPHIHVPCGRGEWESRMLP
jgi:hypothetical protein